MKLSGSPSERQAVLENILDALQSSREQDNKNGFTAFRQVFVPFWQEWRKDHSSYHCYTPHDAPNGAFGPESTLGFIEDFDRTRALLESIRQATKNGVRHVIDAGTGATAILALQAAIAENVEHVLALEIHGPNVFIAGKIVEAFGMAGKIKVIYEDATKYQPENPVDLIISETIDSASLHEPVVEIMQNLRRFLNPNGKLLPKRFRYRFHHIYCNEKKPDSRLMNSDTVFAELNLMQHQGRFVKGLLQPSNGARKFGNSDNIGVSADVDFGSGWLDENDVGIIAHRSTVNLSNCEKSEELKKLLSSGEVIMRIYHGTNRVMFINPKNRSEKITVEFD